MKRLLGAAVFSLALAGMGAVSFAADPVAKPPDVTKDATAWVELVSTGAPVCTPEGDSATSFSCTALIYATPYTFRCVSTAATKDVKGGVVCQVPLPAAEIAVSTK
jgi:hypothetical protein